MQLKVIQPKQLHTHLFISYICYHSTIINAPIPRINLPNNSQTCSSNLHGCEFHATSVQPTLTAVRIQLTTYKNVFKNHNNSKLFKTTASSLISRKHSKHNNCFVPPRLWNTEVFTSFLNTDMPGLAHIRSAIANTQLLYDRTVFKVLLFIFLF